MIVQNTKSLHSLLGRGGMRLLLLVVVVVVRKGRKRKEGCC
jgi:hypothetical protein